MVDQTTPNTGEVDDDPPDPTDVPTVTLGVGPNSNLHELRIGEPGVYIFTGEDREAAGPVEYVSLPTGMATSEYAAEIVSQTGEYWTMLNLPQPLRGVLDGTALNSGEGPDR